ncbi:hypothetical protein CC78DRAFT_106137 [Lojkania enalia]|uniref:Uncharacterized protein n=1 Tax=Lojkania enalia TaxID=147567 RepID=A0A9P4K0S4_9PLEO|nr:hypothetical protein CC78DRAFT_106137 [Didymosphaeria enalia]
MTAVRAVIENNPLQTSGPSATDLPVSLDHLFSDSLALGKINFELVTDNAWENAPANRSLQDADPSESVFGFCVFTFPPEIYVSFNKRDSSRWEPFNCYNEEKEHTIHVIYYDYSEDSTNGRGMIH